MDDGGFYRHEYTQAARGMDLPDIDDVEKFCHACGRLVHFGELCADCQHERNCEDAELEMRGDE